MAEIKIQIPAELGLSDAQQRQLQEKFRNTLVESLSGAEAETVAARKAQVVPKSEKVESIPVVVAS